jgi:hypothetical protein
MPDFVENEKDHFPVGRAGRSEYLAASFESDTVNLESLV